MDALTFLLLFLLSIACLVLKTYVKEYGGIFLVFAGLVFIITGLLVATEGLSFQQVTVRTQNYGYVYDSNSTNSPANYTSSENYSYVTRQDNYTLMLFVILEMIGVYSLLSGAGVV
jgi:hypothetical protein